MDDAGTPKAAAKATLFMDDFRMLSSSLCEKVLKGAK